MHIGKPSAVIVAAALLVGSCGGSGEEEDDLPSMSTDPLGSATELDTGLVPGSVTACNSTVIAVGSRSDDALEFGLLEVIDNTESGSPVIIDSGRAYYSAAMIENCGLIVAAWFEARELGLDLIKADGTITRTIPIGGYTPVGSVASSSSVVYLGARSANETRASLISLDLGTGVVENIEISSEFSDRDPVVIGDRVYFVRHSFSGGTVSSSSIMSLDIGSPIEVISLEPGIVLDGMAAMGERLAAFTVNDGVHEFRIYDLEELEATAISENSQGYRIPGPWFGRDETILAIDPGLDYSSIKAVVIQTSSGN